jgi:hypothetical protein
MPDVHYIFATITVVAIGATTALAAVSFARGLDGQPWLDRLILVELLIGLLSAATGAALVLFASGPEDGLHVLYGIVLLLIIGVGRWLGREGGRRQAGWIALSSVIALGVFGRLVMTG